jgi:hypothetical protein
MNAESIEIENLAAESDLPAMIAALQFSNWGRSTGYGSAAAYAKLPAAPSHDEIVRNVGDELAHRMVRDIVG